MTRRCGRNERVGFLTSLFPLGCATKTTPSMVTWRGSGAGAGAGAAVAMVEVLGVGGAGVAASEAGVGATQVAFL